MMRVSTIQIALFCRSAVLVSFKTQVFCCFLVRLNALGPCFVKSQCNFTLLFSLGGSQQHKVRRLDETPDDVVVDVGAIDRR